MSDYEDFFEMVKEWTVNDYNTQSIKSEVIIDTLISGFIEELLSAHCKVKKEDVKLLAKEFPIRIVFKDNHNTEEDCGNKRNAKVDYLVKVSDTIYLVELKTTNKSLNDKQKERMKKVRDDEKELGKFFIDVIKCQKKNSASQKKYNYTQDKMKKLLGESTIEEVLNDSKIDIMYICLHKPQKYAEKNEDVFKDEKIECLYLEDFLEETAEKTAEREWFNSCLDEQGRENNWNKKKAWNKLKMILKEVVDAAKKFED